jgi:predicted branched-subunit amino acid permease
MPCRSIDLPAAAVSYAGMSAKTPPSDRPAGGPCFTARGVWRGVVDIAPLAAFVVPFGIAFGVAASARGMPAETSVFMSAALFAGMAQFAALDLWHAPLPLAMLALTVLAVNGRLVMLGAALAPWLLKVPAGRRLAALLLLNDSNFAYAMTARARGELDAGILFGSGVIMWVMWAASTAAGALAGSWAGDMSRFGFDAVMVAYFAAVVVGQWRGRGDIAPFAAAAAVAVGGAYILPAGWHIIAGALAGGLVGVWRHG